MFILRFFGFTFNENILNYRSFKHILEFIPSLNTKISEQKINNNSNNGFKLITTINSFYATNILNKQSKVIVSLSGGIDSMVLVTILKLLGCTVIAVHINYNNRAETREEQKFLELWCNYNGIKLHTKVITNIKRATSKRSDYEIESKLIRFGFYKEVMAYENLDCILLAHHKDDIVENIFANVCRGRDILNLAVIKETSNIDNVTIMRPLISHYKSDIYEFAEIYQVPYFKDTTPLWSVRGKYRNNITPALEDTFSSNVKENLISLSKQSDGWNELIMTQIVEPFISTINYTTTSCNFDLNRDSKYSTYPLCFWRIIFMRIFYHFGKNAPSYKGIETFMRDISIRKVSYISLSNQCSCRNKNLYITFEFKP